MSELTFRPAKEQDCGKILYFIRQLAVYEKMEDQVVATEEILREWGYPPSYTSLGNVEFPRLFQYWMRFIGVLAQINYYAYDLFVLLFHRL